MCLESGQGHKDTNDPTRRVFDKCKTHITKIWHVAFISSFTKATLLDFVMVKKTSAAACIGLGGSAPEQKKSWKTRRVSLRICLKLLQDSSRFKIAMPIGFTADPRSSVLKSEAHSEWLWSF